MASSFRPMGPSGKTGVYIDAQGNLRQQAHSGPQAVELRDATGQQRGVGGVRSPTARFATLTDLAPPAVTPSDRPQSFWERLHAFVPFTFNSVLGAVVILQAIVYFASLWVVTPRAWLNPTPTALWKMGSSDFGFTRCATIIGGKYLIELRRLFVPIFLHLNVGHIVMNTLFEVLSGPQMLQTYGTAGFSLLFLVTGTCGNLLSDAAEHNGVGASTACYGLIGAYMSQVMLSWGSIEDEEMRKWTRNMLLLYCGLLVGWELIMWNTLDHFGHLGGLLSGLALAVVLNLDSPTWKRMVCGLALALCMLACILKIFVIGVPATVDMSGTQYPWKTYCDAYWNMYSK